MAVGVTLFNASTLVVSLTVNGGPQIPVPPTGASQNWSPQRQNPTNGPTYAPGNPAPNVIGNSAANAIQAYISGVPVQAGHFPFSIPTETLFSSIQIYVFFLSVQSCSWIALIDGKPFAVQFNTGDILPDKRAGHGSPHISSPHIEPPVGRHPTNHSKN